ncbi:MAG: hypothetical protein ABIG96_05185 [Candidatus Micrarchaeota archaeon]
MASEVKWIGGKNPRLIVPYSLCSPQLLDLVREFKVEERGSVAKGLRGLSRLALRWIWPSASNKKKLSAAKTRMAEGLEPLLQKYMDAAMAVAYGARGTYIHTHETGQMRIHWVEKPTIKLFENDAPHLSKISRFNQALTDIVYVNFGRRRAVLYLKKPLGFNLPPVEFNKVVFESE